MAASPMSPHWQKRPPLPIRLRNLHARWLHLNRRTRIRRRVASEDWLNAPEALRATFRLVLAEDLSPHLEQIAAPVLLVWGDGDEDTPLWMGHRMEELIPDSGLVVLPGAGHYSYADSPGRFAQVSRHFLCHQPREVAKDSR